MEGLVHQSAPSRLPASKLGTWRGRLAQLLAQTQILLGTLLGLGLEET